jgi:arylsulfatase A-like enzyme
MDGWSELRKKRYSRMVKMGLIKDEWTLSPQDPAAAEWDSLDEETKRKMDHKMAIYAAQVDHMDQGVGRVMDALKKNGYDDNTLVMFLSDNGACAESGAFGTNFRPDLKGELGTVDSYQSYGLSWSNASNTPFRKHKQWVHEGGISTPLVVRWPGKVGKPGSLTHQPGHIIDIMPTCCAAAGIEYPAQYKGKDIQPVEGVSLVPVIGGGGLDGHDNFCWEHFGNKAIRSGKWKLVQAVKGGAGPWELYDVEADRTELNNLVDSEPGVVDELKKKYDAWAAKVKV